MPLRERLAGQVARRWALVRRVLPKHYFAYPVRGGWVYLSLGNAPMAIQRLLRVYEPAKFQNIARYLPRGGGFVDVGANAGDFTLWAARCGGPDTRVLAVEAEPQNASWLRRTVDRNGLSSRVYVADVAAAAGEGEAELLLTEWTGTHSIVESELHRELERFRPRGRIKVPTRALDDLLRHAGLPRVDLVKIDVEGAELLVLAGARELLSETTPLTLLIDLHFGVDLAELAALLHGFGFSIRLEDSPDEVIGAIPEGTLSIVAIR